MAIDLYPFYQKYNFKYDGKLAYGYYKNRIVSFVQAGSNIKATISFSIPLLKDQAYQISLKVRDLKGKYRPLIQGLVTNINLELMLYQGSDLLEIIEKLLDEVSLICDQNSTNEIGICPLCGKSLPTDSPFMRIKDAVIQAHNECLSNLEAESNKFNTANIEKEKKNISKPIVISLLISILIVLLNILLGLTQAYPYVVAMSGWLCFYVTSIIYHRFKISLHKIPLIIMEIFSVFTLLLSVYLGSVTYIFTLLIEKPTNILYVISNYGAILSENVELAKIIVYSAVFGLVLILIPFLSFFRRVKNGYVNTMKRL